MNKNISNSTDEICELLNFSMGKKNKETPRYPHAHAFVPVGKFGTPASLHKLVK